MVLMWLNLLGEQYQLDYFFALPFNYTTEMQFKICTQTCLKV